MLLLRWCVFQIHTYLLLLIDLVPQVVHAIYKRYEFGPAQRLLPTFLFLVAVPSLPTYFFREHFSSFLQALWVSFSVFYTTLASSIVLYRISLWHPLAEYPGPFFAKVSKFYGFYMMSTGKNHILHKKLHEKYGPYVRIGERSVPLIEERKLNDYRDSRRAKRDIYD